MQSFESGLTARADDNQPRAPMGQRQPLDIMNKLQVLTSNTRGVTPYLTSVFDILQMYSGVPLPDTLSKDSNEPTVKLSSALTVAPKDDPRFVIWGELLPGDEDMARSSTDLSSGGAPGHRLSHVQNGDSPLPPQEGLKTVIMAATIERWIAQLTSELNYEELLNFFLTYRTYISSIDLCHLLICRFHWALESPVSPNEETVRKIVRVRTFIAIRYWLITFFRIDFVPNPALCQVFSGWLNTLRRDPILIALPDALVRLWPAGTLLCNREGLNRFTNAG
jgi:GDP/GTP exchange factor required for growth at low temperature